MKVAMNFPGKAVSNFHLKWSSPCIRKVSSSPMETVTCLAEGRRGPVEGNRSQQLPSDLAVLAQVTCSRLKLSPCDLATQDCLLNCFISVVFDFSSAFSRFFPVSLSCFAQAGRKTCLFLCRKVSEEERADPAIAAKNHEVVLHFENLLEDWCRQIERFLETSLDQSHELPDAGPRSEIEYWRSRMQRLNSIIEQLKSDNCRLVFQTLYAVSKTSAEKTPKSKQTVFHVLRRCKQIDTAITEAFNEAKDNVKYLSTLRNFMDPLYTGTPQNIIDNLGPLMNAVTMVHSISRHYNTTERMTNFFVKITNQMICNCKKGILADEHPQQLWEREPEEIIRKLEACSRLNDAYHEQYRITKDKLLTTPKGKQFDFSEHLIFGRMDLFCRRVLKLITLFSIIRQFRSISRHCFEGMGVFVERFQQILAEFRSKRHDMLDFTNNRFDRDFVEFTVRVADLESALQPFINQSFASTTSIDASLQLLKKFQSVVHSENLKSELKAKISIIFHRYGWELQQVQQQYERLRANPPIDRAMPPVAGSITWARHLLKRIEGPMKKFEEHPFVLNTREAKKTVRLYNKVAATLVEFELRWHQAWKESVPACKAGLQAPLLARHASSGQLFVNFDPDLVQLLREAKALDRLRLDLPEDAKIVLLRERKLKKYYEDLTFVLMEYRRIASMVRPITAALVQPHLDSMEQIFRPGTATLTWTSMNIDSYLQSIYAGLAKLEQLVTTINDIVENRIDSSLLALSRVRLVDVPTPGEALSLQSFVELQENYVKQVATLLNRRSAEIEGAVHDLLRASLGCLGRRHTPTAYAEDIVKVKAQYKWNLYTALLTSTKNSLLCLKERLQARRNGAEPPAPFFEVDLQLDGQGVRLHPSLEEIQKAVNSSALAILMCSKKVKPWTLSFSTPHSDAQSADATLDAGEREAGDAGQGESFHSRIAQDREILKILLLLTGSIQSTRDEVTDFLGKFDDFAWLWTDSARDTYAAFAAQKPSLDEFEKKIRFFVDVETKLQNMQTTTAIGVLQLNSSGLISQLTELVRGWSLQFLDELHQKARQKLETLTEHIRQMSKRLKRTVSDIDALRHVMETLNYIREKESDVESEFGPIISMYNLLDRYLPSNVTLTDKDEHDQRLMLRSSWLRLLEDAQTCQDNLIGMQTEYKRELIVNINSFKADVKQFRDDFEKNGPAALGIAPREAVERVRRFKEECEMRTRKQEIYYAGEDLFGFPHQSYPELDQTKKEISHLTLLYDLYVQVIDTMKEWKEIHWTDAPGYMPLLTEKIQFFSTCCKKLPKQLKDSDAYLELKKEIDDFIEILPLLEELSKKSIMPRHWKQVEEITGKSFNVENEMLRLQTLTDAGLLQFKDDIVDICDSADKQLIIEEKLSDIEHAWKQTSFDFGTWKTRDYPCVLQGGRVAEIQEALEESQMSLNTMNAMRHVAPFKERVVNMLTTLSDVSDTIDSWTKVQVLWTSLEPVFTGGDIAKQMPAEAKRFHGIDKDWTTIMSKAAETATVVECCQNELLKQLLPVLHGGLESCQKSLESYLEGKRNKFPRFYFVSNPVLLKILSQGSDADSVQEDFEKLFDAISRVVFDKEDRKKIVKIKTVAGSAEEVVTLSAPLKVEGNIEDWLKGLEVQMQRSIRRDCKYAAHETALVGSQLSLRDFCDRYIAQVALLGLQMVWTTDCHEALEKLSRERDKSIMNATNKKFVAMMTDLVAACLSDLGTQLNRTKYETLVTIHVHQRDVFADLWKKVKEHRLRDSSDFEWLKQTRLYWKTDTDNALIAIADVDFTYSYEYLGVKERLAITPLTDRCYLTCSQALGMFYGGAPAGPAGTGKTETVKDMGRTLGVFVVVTNCSDQHRYNDMAKIFKGLCQSGLWGCFDEFNRIDLEVLSVVAMQIESITTAKKQGLRTFMFPGEAAPIRLVPATAYFITMNPGYAGRQELPENLKVLFRSVSMMVPDRQIIIKVKLASVGYLDIDNLSKKFKVLYGLCEEQLSKQRHYDFGLRNILSVLRTAGATKRTDPDADEEMLLMRTLRDMNLSKLVADDVPLFLSLLRDIFPKQADPPKKLYSEVESAVVATIAKNKLLLSDEFLTKVMQLYETSTVRHGFMLVGPTCSGKSEIASTLATALTSIGIPTRSVVMNPKAITAQQMYGVKDPLTEEWTPGIFAWLWAKYNNRALKFNTWLTCDGPVDAIWIENLNTVLDDNKILTLANNDRIPMTENTR
ncbi:putative dynein gamma chain, flagellar outer arm [Toxoplasma gondii VAND]|uniref:Putative dynein gamma chain, flagellar outer arm n=3 Tax=Toxoplasma gondii TaxID=5811 RepID=A0A086PQT5_TOXGO|nr:putative dynein gamma chain, flagellar outer arm [Toxoplasma gondii VAND]